MAAAQLMLEAKVGLLRTLPPADERANAEFLRTARALQVPVPDGATPRSCCGRSTRSDRRPSHS